MMHAVERLDAVIGPRQRISKGRALTAIAEARQVLDQLTEFQRLHMPSSYEEAFRLCCEDLSQREAPHGNTVGANPKTPSSQKGDVA